MKKTILFMALAAMCASCQKTVIDDSESPEQKQITFNIKGDFTLHTSPMTRALTADGKDMTDVWVLDYVGGELQQQIHQTAEDEDFGSPTMSLELGEHNLYFVATRSTGPTLNTSAKTLVFTKILDTFHKALAISVTSGGTESRAVNLDRAVTKLKLNFTDAVPDGTASINITPATWYYGMNYQTGEPVGVMADETIVISVPSSIYGETEQSANVYGFSSATEWTTDIAVNSLDDEDNIIGSANIENAPFVRNRISEYTGNLWTAGSGMTLNLNTDWLDSYEGSW